MKVGNMKTLLLALVATVFASSAFAQSGYQIRSGDTLSIEVLEDPSLNRTVLVLPDGTISFPFAGSIRASGRTAGDVDAAITSGIASNFASEPNVFVTVQALTTTAASTGGGVAQVHIFMMGQIAAPGEKHLRRGTTLIQALAETGGFTSFAATKRIVLRRTDKRTGEQSVSTINYKAIADGAAVGSDIVLRDGDVIIVPERRLFE
jgi:polysaccharide export outer membrane protein